MEESEYICFLRIKVFIKKKAKKLIQNKPVLRTPPMKDLSYMGNNFKMSELFHLLCLYKPHFGCLSLRDLSNVRLLSKGCL